MPEPKLHLDADASRESLQTAMVELASFWDTHDFTEFEGQVEEGRRP